jgi:hypothetical protein
MASPRNEKWHWLSCSSEKKTRHSVPLLFGLPKGQK